MSGSYALLAAVRRKELPTRLIIAVVLAGVGYWLAPSAWPLVWLALVFVSQLGDLAVYRGLTGEPSRHRLIVWAASTALSTAVYSALAVHLWMFAGDSGHMFGLLLAAGGLLHVTIHMHHVRTLLISAAVPHALVFFGLPLASVARGDTQMWVIVLGAAMYVAHLMVAFRQADSTTREIQAERNRAEEASKAKSDFLATISHEIRTPMNAIVSAANLLSGSRLNRAQREQVEMLTDANDVLLSLLNDVLDLSKIEAGKMTVEAADADLRRMLEGLQRLWQPRAADKGLDLRLEIDADLPQVVRVDPLRLKQILFNLISNAVKFTDAGSVTVRLAPAADDEREVLAFEVVDTGAGIPEALMRRLFGAFEQGDAGATRAQGGSGLGLAISRRLAGMMGGTLDAASTAGQGSTFRLILPLVRSVAGAAPAADEPAEPSPVTLAGLRVLAAEDHPVNRRVLELLLAPLGCQLTFCEDGAQAVELAGVEAFDAILMDMQMPVLDGVEATRRIKAGGGANAEAPVIALTANALEHHRAAWAEVGVDLFVSKPIDPRQLVGCLVQAADRTPGRRAA
ncbi:ATP-binding protein [Phenylobacterium sp.]|uniref:ATP-binding protein n=1 Tax=Phenylobacterium sp. TaxID=1871053 RepID=UPI002EDB185A